MKLSLVYIAFASIIGISGCAYENAAQRAEFDKKSSLLAKSEHVDALLGEPTVKSARYAFRLSDAYKNLGDTAAANRDKFAAGIIVVAGAAALGTATSAGSTELVQAAAIGLGLNEVVRYTNQSGAAEGFYKASDEMACIASKTVGFVKTDTHNNLESNAVVLEYIRRAELRLRSRLRRTVPDYTTVFGRISDGLPSQIVDGKKASLSLREVLETCLPADEKPAQAESTSPQPPTPQPTPTLPPETENGDEPTVVAPTL